MPDKYLYNNAGTTTEKEAINTSAGAGDAGKIVAADASGKLATSFLPTGVGPDTFTVTASEALAAGDLVNIWNSSGAKARKADASVAGKYAHGFVLAAVSSSGSALVYRSGANTGVTGLTPGDQFLSTTPGLATGTAPSGTGNVVQRVGMASAATELEFLAGDPIVLA